MKRIYIFLFIALLGYGSLCAQETSLGIKGGLNISDLGGQQSALVTRLAYHAGAFAEFGVTPFFSVQIELVYSLQGAAIDRSREVMLNYNYLNFPLFAKIYFYEDASFDLGMQYGYLFNAVEKNDFGKVDINNQVRHHDFSVVMGLSYILSEKFLFSLRYNLGISNTAEQNVVWELRKTNRVLQLSIGYVF